MARQGPLTIQVNFKLFLIVLVISTAVILVDMFLVLDRSSRALDETLQGQFETIARVAANGASRWVNGRIALLGVVAANPEVRRQAADANRRYQGQSPAAIAERLRAIDQGWQGPGASAEATRMLANPASDFMREFSSIAPSFKRLLLTDREGASIAGTHKSIDYYQGDEDWWTQSVGDGRTGRIHVEDVRHDPVTRSYFIGVNMPVLDAREERVIGALRAVVDVAELSPITGQIRFGETGEGLLVNGSALVISSGRIEFSPDRKSEELEAIREVWGAPGAPGGRNSGAGHISLRGGARRYVGFANVGLAQSFPALDWTAIVRQNHDEAIAPFQSIDTRILLSGFGGIFLVAVLGVYFYLHSPRERPVMKEESAT